METIIVYPKTKDELKALKACIKALKIDFKIADSSYNPEFTSKVKRGEQDVKQE